MFDGLPARRQVTRTKTGYSIATGHPPVAEQLASQVRSSSGMTFGRPRPGGGLAMMHSAFISGRIAETHHARLEPIVHAGTVRDGATLGERLLAELRAIDADDLVLPNRAVWRARHGRGVMPALHNLKRMGHIKLWCGTADDRVDIASEMVIRLKGSARELRTRGAPSYISV